MRSGNKAIVLVIAATLAEACSSSPRTAKPQSTPQTLAAASGAPAAGGAPAGDVDASLVKQGYSVLRRHDEVFYCRTEIITGNRISTRICLTAGQIQDEKHDVMKAKDILNTPANRCVGALCNN
jgi:hypothetical protein